jgi:hypothetical protein
MTTILNASTSAGLVITPDTSGNIQLQYNGVAAPAFSAYRSSTQLITVSTWTKIQFDGENFDTANCYDNSTNYRFTPTVAGYYQVSVSGALTGAATYVYFSIAKNGTRIITTPFAGSGGVGGCVSALIYCNGSTDYLEGYVFKDGSYDLVGGTNGYTMFHGCLLRGA